MQKEEIKIKDDGMCISVKQWVELEHEGALLKSRPLRYNVFPGQEGPEGLVSPAVQKAIDLYHTPEIIAEYEQKKQESREALENEPQTGEGE